MEVDAAQIQPDTHICERAKRWIFDRTVAIYFRKRDGNPKHWGSGVLLQLGDAAFLVTASHVLAIVSEGAEILIGSMSTDAKGLVSIGERVVVRTEEAKLDLAIVRLPDTAVKALAPVKRFVRWSEIDRERALMQGRYYVAGYPIEITNTDHTAKTITIGPYTSATHLVDSESAHPGVSIALAHGKDSITRSDDSRRVRPPALQGVSGCGIWRLWATADFEQLDHWDESWIRLVGIEHRIVGEAMIGTLFCHVIEMLLRTQPVELSLSAAGATLRFP